jgi:putative ABC transport system permease protein
MSSLMQHVTQTFRRLGASPGFTVLAVLMVGLGVGASTAIFSVVNGALLQPLPFREPERVMRVWESNPGRGWDTFSVAEPNFLDWQERGHGFEAMGAIRSESVNLTGLEEPERLQGGEVSAGFFPLLGLEPSLGRLFRPEEDRPGGDHRVVLLSQGLWQRRFGADPAVIGRTLALNGEPHVVIGVVAVPLRDFQADLYTPLAADAAADREDHDLAVFARLRPGVTRAQAQAELAAVAATLAREHPETNTGWGVRTASLFESVVDAPFRHALLVLCGAVGCLLLVACANVASLLLGRATGRSQEIAVRAALGASRSRLLGHLLAEALAVGGLGGALGALLAGWGVDLLKSLDVHNVPRLDQVAVDGRVLLFALGLSLAAGLLSGLVPALRAAATSPRQALQEGGRSVLGRLADRRLQAGLVIGEVALSLVLLVGAGLLLRSYAKLGEVEVGFDLEDRLVIGLSPPAASYPEVQDMAALYRRLIERLEALPTVRSAAAVNALPFGSFNTKMQFELPGRPEVDNGPPRSASWRLVTPDYFRTLGIPLMRGRIFTDADDHTVPDVAIISQRLADLFWPGEDPVGQRIGSSSTIVGVVGDVRERSLAEEPGPMIYFSYYQTGWRNMPLVLHLDAPSEVVLPQVRAIVAAIDPALPVSDVRRLDELLADTLAPRRLHLVLLTVFALVALVLAGGGLYAVVASAVSFRRREIGIRVALGASASGVVRMVVRWGIGLMAAGLACGLAVAALLTGTLSSLLYGIRPLDFATFGGVALLLATVGLAACGLPALAAGRVDPRESLQAD